MKTIVLAIAILLLTAPSALRADLVVFDGSVQQPGGFIGGGNGTTEIVSFGGDDVLRFTPAANYNSGGLQFYGGDVFTVPVADTTLKVRAYSTDAGNFNGFVINLNSGTGEFNSGSGDWTLNGNVGATGDFAAGVWHEMEFDLNSVAGFVSGTSQVDGFIAFKNNESQRPIYISDISFVSAVPEPSSFALLSIVAGLGLIRRRRNG